MGDLNEEQWITELAIVALKMVSKCVFAPSNHAVSKNFYLAPFASPTLIDVSLCSLRQELRQRRKAVIGDRREQKSLAAANNVMRYIQSRPEVEAVGVFLSLDEEIDTHPLIKQLWAEKYAVFLPVVVTKNAPLYWRRFLPDTILMPDAMGIPAPTLENDAQRRNIAPNFFILPLVGYDQYGNRLGMGGGYYDRSFVGKVRGDAPWLVGLAYACQAVDLLPIRSWDIPLDALANEYALLHFK